MRKSTDRLSLSHDLEPSISPNDASSLLDEATSTTEVSPTKTEKVKLIKLQKALEYNAAFSEQLQALKKSLFVGEDSVYGSYQENLQDVQEDEDLSPEEKKQLQSQFDTNIALLNQLKTQFEQIEEDSSLSTLAKLLNILSEISVTLSEVQKTTIENNSANLALAKDLESKFTKSFNNRSVLHCLFHRANTPVKTKHYESINKSLNHYAANGWRSEKPSASTNIVSNAVNLIQSGKVTANNIEKDLPALSKRKLIRMASISSPNDEFGFLLDLAQEGTATKILGAAIAAKNPELFNELLNFQQTITQANREETTNKVILSSQLISSLLTAIRNTQLTSEEKIELVQALFRRTVSQHIERKQAVDDEKLLSALLKELPHFAVSSSSTSSTSTTNTSSTSSSASFSARESAIGQALVFLTSLTLPQFADRIFNQLIQLPDVQGYIKKDTLWIAKFSPTQLKVYFEQLYDNRKDPELASVIPVCVKAIQNHWDALAHAKDKPVVLQERKKVLNMLWEEFGKALAYATDDTKKEILKGPALKQTLRENLTPTHYVAIDKTPVSPEAVKTSFSVFETEYNKLYKNFIDDTPAASGKQSKNTTVLQRYEAACKPGWFSSGPTAVQKNLQDYNRKKLTMLATALRNIETNPKFSAIEKLEKCLFAIQSARTEIVDYYLRIKKIAGSKGETFTDSATENLIRKEIDTLLQACAKNNAVITCFDFPRSAPEYSEDLQKPGYVYIFSSFKGYESINTSTTATRATPMSAFWTTATSLPSSSSSSSSSSEQLSASSRATQPLEVSIRKEPRTNNPSPALRAPSPRSRGEGENEGSSLEATQPLEVSIRKEPRTNNPSPALRAPSPRSRGEGENEGSSLEATQPLEVSIRKEPRTNNPSPALRAPSPRSRGEGENEGSSLEATQPLEVSIRKEPRTNNPSPALRAPSPRSRGEGENEGSSLEATQPLEVSIRKEPRTNNPSPALRAPSPRSRGEGENEGSSLEATQPLEVSIRKEPRTNNPSPALRAPSPRSRGEGENEGSSLEATQPLEVSIRKEPRTNNPSPALRAPSPRSRGEGENEGSSLDAVETKPTMTKQQSSKEGFFSSTAKQLEPKTQKAIQLIFTLLSAENGDESIRHGRYPEKSKKTCIKELLDLPNVVKTLSVDKKVLRTLIEASRHEPELSGLFPPVYSVGEARICNQAFSKNLSRLSTNLQMLFVNYQQFTATPDFNSSCLNELTKKVTIFIESSRDTGITALWKFKTVLQLIADTREQIISNKSSDFKDTTALIKALDKTCSNILNDPTVKLYLGLEKVEVIQPSQNQPFQQIVLVYREDFTAIQSAYEHSINKYERDGMLAEKASQPPGTFGF